MLQRRLGRAQALNVFSECVVDRGEQDPYFDHRWIAPDRLTQRLQRFRIVIRRRELLAALDIAEGAFALPRSRHGSPPSRAQDGKRKLALDTPCTERHSTSCARRPQAPEPSSCCVSSLKRSGE